MAKIPDDVSGDVLKCWQEGRLIFQRTGMDIGADKLPGATEIKSDGKTVQVLDLKQGVCIFDRMGRLVGWNQRVGELLSIPMGRFSIGSSFHTIFDRFRTEFAFLEGMRADRVEDWASGVQRNGALSFEVEHRSERTLAVFMQEMPDSGFVISFTDISAERAAVRAISEVNETLERRVRPLVESLGMDFMVPADVTNDAEMAEAFDAIAFPGMTANFDAAKSAAMAVTMLDWRDHGQAYAAKMIEVAQGLAAGLKARGVPVFETAQGATSSHQFAVRAAAYGGGQAASKQLRKAGFLACGIGLPIEGVAGDMNGLRIGTPELVRWGMDVEHIDRMADLIAEALASNDPSAMASRVRDWRETFDQLHYVS